MHIPCAWATTEKIPIINHFALVALAFLTCLWFALIFDVADIVGHLGDVLLIMDKDESSAVPVALSSATAKFLRTLFQPGFLKELF